MSERSEFFECQRAECPWRDRLLSLASEVGAILVQRGEVYGDPARAFRTYAALFSAVLALEVSPAQAALLLAALKLGRLAWETGHLDSWLDLAGYALIGALLAAEGEEPSCETRCAQA